MHVYILYARDAYWVTRCSRTELEDLDMENSFLSASAERRMNSLFGKLSELNEVVLKLQLVDCTIREARVYADSILESYFTLMGN